MKKFGIVLSVILVGAFSVFAYRKKKRQSGLGKLEVKMYKRPPKIKMIYDFKPKISQLPKVASSEDVNKLVHKVWDNDLHLRESFVVLIMSRANRVKGFINVSKGGTTGTVADPKLIFAPAIQTSSPSIIVVHNHPSGNTYPSKADRILTDRLVEAGKLLDVQVLDHMIITPDKEYYSFADEGEI